MSVRTRQESDPPEDPQRELREKKRVLAALVVHDLRSPLSAIHGYLNLIREEVSSDAAEKSAKSSKDQTLAYVDDAMTLVNKALGLVATILDVDELEDGILRAQVAPVRIIEMIERARSGNRAQFEVRELNVDVDVDPDMVVRLDRDLFSRIVENLIDNSARYAPRGGRCAISVRRDSAGVEIAIGNSGPPVPESERARIFGRYFQVEARRAAARANRGLGLYFCKLAAEAHGGTIHVEQRGDLGAVFVVRIPE